jgi:hypothetical protein
MDIFLPDGPDKGPLISNSACSVRTVANDEGRRKNMKDEEYSAYLQYVRVRTVESTLIRSLKYIFSNLVCVKRGKRRHVHLPQKHRSPDLEEEYDITV